MSDRCEDGRLIRHKPFPDDPYYEHDVGPCPYCAAEQKRADEELAARAAECS